MKKIIFITVLVIVSCFGLIACDDNETNDEYDGSVGLALTISNDETCYYVTGIGECQETDIIIPSTYNGKPVTIIAVESFKGSSITSVTIPETITYVLDYAFSECTSLTTVTFHENIQLKTICSSLFKGCSNLVNITIPNSVTLINNNAFDGCAKLKNITVPANVEKIAPEAFVGCYELESITFEDTTTWYYTDNNKDYVVMLRGTEVDLSDAKLVADYFNSVGEWSSRYYYKR